MASSPPPLPTPPAAWAEQWRDELQVNVIPWWRRNIFDADGRVLAGRGHDGQPLDGPRSAVLGTRLLWTFASAGQRLGMDTTRSVDWAWAWLDDALTDREHGGVFWSVDAHGRALATHKQVYAQAFAIYALCACHAARPAPEAPALRQAVALFELIDAHAFDAAEGGCWEGFTRGWQLLPGARLSDKEPPAPKTMNTMLHMVEALTELLRHLRAPGVLHASATPAVASRLRELLELFVNQLWLPGPRGFGLFFSREWRVLTPQVSWGHDIEAAWLLVRAADVLGMSSLQARTREVAVQVADAVLSHGVAADGSVLAEGRVQRQADGRFQVQVTDDQRHWWCQAEAVVGFWNAWQISGDPRHAQAAWQAWRYIDTHHVDRAGGDWFKTLDAGSAPLLHIPKAGPWECPYHHVRAGLEMIERLKG